MYRQSFSIKDFYLFQVSVTDFYCTFNLCNQIEFNVENEDKSLFIHLYSIRCYLTANPRDIVQMGWIFSSPIFSPAKNLGSTNQYLDIRNYTMGTFCWSQATSWFDWRSSFRWFSVAACCHSRTKWLTYDNNSFLSLYKANLAFCELLRATSLFVVSQTYALVTW